MLHLGLTGYPLSHSLSPIIHLTALKSFGIPGEYRLIPIQPLSDFTQELSKLITKMHLGELDGFNVTIPYKQSIIPLVDDLTPIAHACGAVNTVFRSGSKIIGDNTDVPGFLADLEVTTHISNIKSDQVGHSTSAPFGINHTDPPQPRLALILGAGGSARAICFALLQCGWSIYLCARRVQQAEVIVEEMCKYGQFGIDGYLEVVPFEPSALQISPPPNLIVNTTPIGMFPDIENSPWPESIPFPQRAVVYDLVYNPFETALVRDAHKAGLLAVNGLGMLVEQAALAFERWTGKKPSRAGIYKAAGETLINDQNRM